MASIFQRKLNHELPIKQQDIAYFIVTTPAYRPDSMSLESYDALQAEIVYAAQDEVESKYGATFNIVSSLKTVKFDQHKINYFLFGLLDPFKIDRSLHIEIARARKAPNARVNIAAIYPLASKQRASDLIPAFDLANHVNTIYQDSVVVADGKKYLTISVVDAADNMVCETFRVKYKALAITDSSAMKKLEEARAEAWADVKAMAAIYDKYQLWHRSPYDGAFMFRTKHGWLTTATRTPKNHVTHKDLTLILGFDESTDTIQYVGDRLPSSDLPEFLVLVERNEQALASEGETSPVIRYMAHFHKNELTRNQELMNYAVPFSRYGVFESGHTFANNLLLEGKALDGINIHGQGRGFIILEHGLVRMGVKLEHLEDFLEELYASSTLL